jgi:uncharacterized membrane-anchored protein
LFWALKIIAVTLGETASDQFAIELKIGYATCAVAFFVFFFTVACLQMRAKRFHPSLFWTVIFSTSIVGTSISDLMDRGIGHSGTVTQNGIGYGPGAIILTSILVVIFLVWWRTGQTYDVEKIATRKGEALYWIAILVSNTLGTASGDWLAHGTGLGFRNAFFVIAGIMLLLLAAHYLTSINSMVLFWLAFVLTRPLSAAAGDSITKPVSQGGLGLGTLWGSVTLAAVLTVLVACQTWHLRRHPLDLLPAPTHRITGQPQQPNGQVVLAYGPHPDQILQTSKGAGASGLTPGQREGVGRPGRPHQARGQACEEEAEDRPAGRAVEAAAHRRAEALADRLARDQGARRRAGVPGDDADGRAGEERCEDEACQDHAGQQEHVRGLGADGDDNRGQSEQRD